MARCMLGPQVEHLSVVVQKDFVWDARGRRAVRADALSFVVHVYVAIVVDVITRHPIVTFVQHAKPIAPGHILAGTVDHVRSAACTHMAAVVEGREHACTLVTVVLNHCPTRVWAFL